MKKEDALEDALKVKVKEEEDVPGVSPANLGGQPSWLPPTPAWDIQPWESPPVGGGAPPQAVVYRSNTQSFPPTANSDHRFPYRDAHSYPDQNAPSMPMPGPASAAAEMEAAAQKGTGIADVVGLQGMPGGVQSTSSNSLCYQQCVHGLGLSKTAMLTETARQSMVASCLQSCGFNSGMLHPYMHPMLHSFAHHPFVHPSTLSPLIGSMATHLSPHSLHPSMVMGGAHVQCVLTCAAQGAKQLESKSPAPTAIHRRLRRRLLAQGNQQESHPESDMSNSCISGCAHGGMYTWHGAMNPVGGVHPLLHPYGHALAMHPAFGMYGPPMPTAVLLEQQEKEHKDTVEKHQGKEYVQAADNAGAAAFTSNAVAAAAAAAAAASAANHPTSTILHHASVVGAVDVYAAVAPITSCVMQCVGMGLAAMKEQDDQRDDTQKETGFSDHLQMSYSCMAGCNHGTPFMFNWKTPLMPGNLHAWALTHQGSVALLPTQVSTTPLDGSSCVMQCLAMGGESMMKWNKGK